jgi:hypothetical protein
LAVDLQGNRPPEIYSVTASPLSLQAGQFSSFSAIVDDPDQDELSFLWDFGDGSTMPVFDTQLGKLGAVIVLGELYAFGD